MHSKNIDKLYEETRHHSLVRASSNRLSQICLEKLELSEGLELSGTEYKITCKVLKYQKKDQADF